MASIFTSASTLRNKIKALTAQKAILKEDRQEYYCEMNLTSSLDEAFEYAELIDEVDEELLAIQEQLESLRIRLRKAVVREVKTKNSTLPDHYSDKPEAVIVGNRVKA